MNIPYLFKNFVDQTGVLTTNVASQMSNYFLHKFAEDLDANYYDNQEVFDYLSNSVIPHKVAVYKAGIEIFEKLDSSVIKYNNSLFLRNLVYHDLSKFSAIESVGYSGWNFKTKTGNHEAFVSAWHHHKHHNPHHPEYWMDVSRDGCLKLLPMPMHFILEMVADWSGASRTYGTPFEEWADTNLPLFRFHERTAKALLEILQKIGYKNTYIFDGHIYFRD